MFVQNRSEPNANQTKITPSKQVPPPNTTSVMAKVALWEGKSPHSQAASLSPEMTVNAIKLPPKSPQTSSSASVVKKPLTHIPQSYQPSVTQSTRKMHATNSNGTKPSKKKEIGQHAQALFGKGLRGLERGFEKACNEFSDWIVPTVNQNNNNNNNNNASTTPSPSIVPQNQVVASSASKVSPPISSVVNQSLSVGELFYCCQEKRMWK